MAVRRVSKARFVFADFDFSETNTVKVYTIDAKTGASTKATVGGAAFTTP